MEFYEVNFIDVYNILYVILRYGKTLDNYYIHNIEKSSLNKAYAFSNRIKSHNFINRTW